MIARWLAALFAISATSAFAETDVDIGVYWAQSDEIMLPLSRLDLPTDNLGFAGASLGIEDNQTTGSFIGLNFAEHDFSGSVEDVKAKIEADYQSGMRLFVLNAPAETQIELSDQYPDALFFNTSAREIGLRNADCRANLLHITPSHAMSADGLIQYLMWKKWEDIFLIYGSHEDDIALAEAYRNSISKFGAKLASEKEFTDTGGSRQTDTGYVLVQQQIPVFTQDAGKYDVAIAADANEVFAAYLPYRTWEARPVAGTAGLRPLSWDPSLEAWGATQFQRRFEENWQRYMREEDYQNWLAIRVIGEAVVRTNSSDPKTLRDYILSDDFEIAAFKGVPLNFRQWNGQLRQPILLSDNHLMVSVSPQEGYLHQFSELDTLGYDQSESSCDKF